MAATAAAGTLAGCSVFPSEAGPDDGAAPEVTVLPNHALHFDGVGDYATCGTAGFPSAANPQTLSLWVRYGAPAGDGDSGAQVFLALRRDQTTGVELGIRGGTLAAWTVYGTRTLAAAPSLPPAGVWHHVAFVLDAGDAGAVASLYVDGVLSASGAAEPNALTPIACWIGSPDGTADLFAGDMDEIRVWNVARTAAEVAEEMQGGAPPPQRGLVAAFDGDEIAGSRLPDRSGNDNDATLGGGDPTRMPTLVPSGLPSSVAP